MYKSLESRKSVSPGGKLMLGLAQTAADNRASRPVGDAATLDLKWGNPAPVLRVSKPATGLWKSVRNLLDLWERTP